MILSWFMILFRTQDIDDFTLQSRRRSTVQLIDDDYILVSGVQKCTKSVHSKYHALWRTKLHAMNQYIRK